jgi:hypothetical protein
MKLLCKLFGHKFYSPVQHFEVISGSQQRFEEDNPPICLRCGFKGAER